MADQPKNAQQGQTRDFLSQYGEYLEGRRSYSDLPVPTDAEIKSVEASLRASEKKR